MIRTLFFDLFNTLVSVAEVPLEVGKLTADVLGVGHEQWNAVCFSEHHEIRRPTDHLEVLTALARRLDPAMPLQRIAQATQHRQRRFDHALQNIRPEILATLRRLRREGLRLALISNASTAEVSSWPRSPLASLMDEAIFSCECGYMKPDAAIYRHALECMRCEASHSLYIGDGGSQELLGAHQLGFITVQTTQFTRPQRLAAIQEQQGKAIDYRIQELGEIGKVLEKPVKRATGREGPVEI